MPDELILDEDENYDLGPYFQTATEEGDEDYLWMLAMASLLGMAFALNSLNPSGPIESPTFPKAPIPIEDIPASTFKQVYEFKIDITLKPYSYSFTDQEIEYYKQMAEEFKQYGRITDPNSIEMKAYANAQRISDMTGQFGNIEAYKAGYLDEAGNQKFEVLIDWIPAGGNTCDDCQDLADHGPYPPHLYPGPPHYKCYCIPGDPVPVIIET